MSRLIAPFVPYMAENMYQNLVRSVNDSAPLSVHLNDFPACNAAFIDPAMEKQMSALIEVVQLGRACRNAASMKVRQPVKALYVKGASFEGEYVDLAEDELNVKQVIFTEDARAFTSYKLKPQLRTLGPRYGKLLGKLSQHLATMDGNDVVDAFNRGESVSFELDATQVVLEKDDVLTEPMQKPGFMALTDHDVTVVLDTNLTPELIQEGFVREVISKLQTMRKDTDFDVTDRIHVTFKAGEKLTSAIESGRAKIEKGVLALSLTAGETPDGAVTKEWDINGETAVLSVKRV
jgi:isoleucyl-tRNA synthetase